MKITFLGSSHGVPEADRKCTSILIEAGECRYIVDMGTHTAEALTAKGIAVDSINAIFITHFHGDHTNGLISYLDLCSWYYKKADPQIFLPGNIDGPIKAIDLWLRCNGNSLRDFRFNGVEGGLLFDDGTVKVLAYPTKHTNNSYAYLIEAEGKRVLYTGDLSHTPEDDFPKQILEFSLDLVIGESAHFEATKYLDILKDAKEINSLCITHYSPRFLISVEELEKAKVPYKVFRAYDGLEIII